MRKDIQEHLKKCPTCLVHVPKADKTPMGEMPIPNYPMQIVAMDLIGPFGITDQGNKYCLNVIDHLTGWAECYPLPSKSSQHVEEALAKDFFPRHGIPEVILTDQGQEFNAKTFRMYLKGLGVDHRRTTPYNPQANGKIERFNRTLKEIIARLVNNDARKWEDQLSNALMAYRHSVSNVTGYTPFYLLYGRRGRLPLTKVMRATKEPHVLQGRLADLSEALTKARQNLESSREFNRQRINQKANAGDIQIGDTVTVKAQERMTLTSKWDPQYEAVRMRGPVCWIRHQQTGKTKTVNRNKLKPVDPNIVWDDVRPRPVRNPRKTTIPQPTAQFAPQLTPTTEAEETAEEPEPAEENTPAVEAETETNQTEQTQAKKIPTFKEFAHPYNTRYRKKQLEQIRCQPMETTEEKRARVDQPMEVNTIWLYLSPLYHCW